VTAPLTITAAAMAGRPRILGVVDALAELFGDLAAGRVGFAERTVIDHGPGRQLLASPAVWERRGVGSVKVTTLTPGNPALGLPLIHGIVVLTDLETGRITALLDGAELTAVRTGAVAALATRLCTREEAGDLAMIGAGVQARALILAIAAVRPLHRVRVHSRTRGSAEALVKWMDEAGLRVPAAVCDTAEAAVTDADIVCTATSTQDSTPVVDAGWVKPGAHVNAIGGTDHHAVEVDPALLADAYVVVEDRGAAAEGAGEVRAALDRGLLTVAGLHEVGALVNGDATARGRTSVFRGIGMALEDTAAAVALYEAAVRDA